MDSYIMTKYYRVVSEQKALPTRSLIPINFFSEDTEKHFKTNMLNSKLKIFSNQFLPLYTLSQWWYHTTIDPGPQCIIQKGNFVISLALSPHIATQHQPYGFYLLTTFGKVSPRAMCVTYISHINNAK